MRRNPWKPSVLVGMILLGCQSIANDEDGAAIGVRHDRDALVTLYHATGGPGWARRENWLSDEPLGTWHGVETNDAGRVVHLELAENRLVGPIPRELAGLTEIVHLSLRGNQLTGSIPPELGTLAQLNHLDLYINNLNGRIPPELAELPNLTQLLLGFNRFTGPIPRKSAPCPGWRGYGSTTTSWRVRYRLNSAISGCNSSGSTFSETKVLLGHFQWNSCS